MKLVIKLRISPARMAWWCGLLGLDNRSSPGPPHAAPDCTGGSANVYTLESFGHTDVGCVRRKNEDYFRIESQLGFYAVADGMGGAEGGEFASRLAVDTVAEHIVSAEKREPQLLLSVLEEAKRRVVEAASGALNLKGMDATLLAGATPGVARTITR